jgi:hypothetical protein
LAALAVTLINRSSLTRNCWAAGALLFVVVAIIFALKANRPSATRQSSTDPLIAGRSADYADLGQRTEKLTSRSAFICVHLRNLRISI